MTITTLYTMAWRNLWRNRRRSLVTIVSLAFGFAAVAIFAGYTHAIYTALGISSIHGEGLGHLSIIHKDWDTEGKLHPDKYLLTDKDISTTTEIVRRAYPDAYVIPKIGVSGLISNGRSSTVFIAQGIKAEDQQILRGPFRNVPGALDPAKPSGVTLAQGLADILGFREGDSASVLVSTIHGQANAADADVNATVNTGLAATNDKMIRMPIAMAQGLLDAPGRADTLTVLLPEFLPSSGGQFEMQSIFTTRVPGETQTRAIRDTLRPLLQGAGLDVEVNTWQEGSAYYRQVKTMYDMIFALMLCVVLAIVVLSIANAMSMAVVERTREIGTLRAIGMRRHGIAALFIGEAFVLVMVGIIAGVVLTALVRWGVNTSDIQYVPPGNTSPVPVYIGVDIVRTAVAAILLAVLAVGAGYLPARRAAQRAIPESLGHI